VGAQLRLKGEWVEVQGMTVHKGRPLIRLPGITTAEAAQALQWEYLEAHGRPELSEDEVLAQDLMGLLVFTSGGRELGPVDNVLNYPAHDILVIGEVMIPFIKEFVKDVNLESKRITVELIPGMLPEDAE
jgi:16S rRNA processing protein RimM